MKMLLATFAAALLSTMIAPNVPGAPPIARGGDGATLKGEYLEARTCDVWVGACYANAETSEAGREATIAWKFTEGKWKDVDLKGVAAVLIVEAKATLGDKYHSPLPVRNVLLLDEKATDAQLVALREFVKAQMGELASNVIEEKLVKIEMKLDCCEKKGCAKLDAGEIVHVETRCMAEKDKICGHEDTYYPPLNSLAEQKPAFTVEHRVKGTLLLHEWNDRETRSAFLGKFEVKSPQPEKAVDPDQVIAR